MVPFLNLPVLGGAVLPACVAIILVAVLLLLVRRARLLGSRGTVLAVLAAALTPVLGSVAVDSLWQPFADPVGWGTWVWLAPATLAVVLLIAGVVAAIREREKGGALGVALDVVVVAALVAATSVGVNAYYGAYRTVGDLLGLNTPADDVTALAMPDAPARVVGGHVENSLGARIHAQYPDGNTGGPATSGFIADVTIPATLSGFPARKAVVYLPPAALSDNPPALPVLILIAGQPGAPTDWIQKGGLLPTMDAHADSHGGRTPIVVMPDPLSGATVNPLCSDTSKWKAATYLEEDVTGWVDANFGAAPSPEYRAVGGLSNGGTCAAQLLARGPQKFPVAINLSGEEHPSISADPQTTINKGFDGNPSLFAANDPISLWEAAGDDGSDGKYRGTHMFFGVGAQDKRFGPPLRKVASAAQSAGIDVTSTEVPGAHTWKVWATLLPTALNWYESILEGA